MELVRKKKKLSKTLNNILNIKNDSYNIQSMVISIPNFFVMKKGLNVKMLNLILILKKFIEHYEDPDFIITSLYSKLTTYFNNTNDYDILKKDANYIINRSLFFEINDFDIVMNNLYDGDIPPRLINMLTDLINDESFLGLYNTNMHNIKYLKNKDDRRYSTEYKKIPTILKETITTLMQDEDIKDFLSKPDPVFPSICETLYDVLEPVKKEILNEKYQLLGGGRLYKNTGRYYKKYLKYKQKYLKLKNKYLNY